MINKTKTKILTLSVASALGLAAITVLASNANNLLDFQGGVKQNAHLELNELKLIENPANPGASSSTDIVWNMNGGALEVTTQENYSTNNSLGKLSRNKRRPGFRRPGWLGFIQSIKRGLSNRVEGEWTLSIGGKENTISAFDSFILGGSGNTLYADTSIIGASNEVRGGDWWGNIVLSSSSGANFSGSNNIILSSSGVSVYGTGNIVISASSWTIRASSWSMAIGHEVIIHHDGTFVFNGKPGTKAYSSKEYTTLISAQNGMIINTNAKKAHNVGLTINWGLKVGRTTDLDQQWSLIVQDDCLQLKSTINGGIWFYCLTKNNKKAITPKCGKNAQEFPTSATAWLGQRQIDFCQEGKVVRFPAFFTEAEPLTRIWRCTTSDGNSVVCQATQQVKVPKPTTCPSWQHLEGTTCVSDSKQVSCDKKNIETQNGFITNPQVEIKWSNGKWSSPDKCTLKCNEGFSANTGVNGKIFCMQNITLYTGSCQNTHLWDTWDTTTLGNVLKIYKQEDAECKIKNIKYIEGYFCKNGNTKTVGSGKVTMDNISSIEVKIDGPLQKSFTKISTYQNRGATIKYTYDVYQWTKKIGTGGIDTIKQELCKGWGRGKNGHRNVQPCILDSDVNKCGW